jgi:hypothetical protein
MNLVPLFAATALALSGTVLAQSTPDAANPPVASAPEPQQGAPFSGDAPATPETEAKAPQGFVVIQRNIYVPVDAEGKATSDEVVVVDRQGYVTAEELRAAQPEAAANEAPRKEPESATKPEAPASSPAPARTPRLPHGLPRDASRITT